MSSPKAPRTPLKPTDKANGTPKSPDSVKKTSAPPKADHVMKKRVPSQNVKTDAPAPHKDASPQTPRPKPPKPAGDKLPQTPTPDRSSKRQSVTDAPPPKFKAAIPDQGGAVKPVNKKVTKHSPPADVENEKHEQVNKIQNGVKKSKKQAPSPPPEDAGGEDIQSEQLQHRAEKVKPKFKATDLDSGETLAVKKKTRPPPEPEQEPKHEDQAESDHNEGDHDSEGHGDEHHEDSSHEGVAGHESSDGENRASDEINDEWSDEHEDHPDEGDDDYDGHGEEEHDDGTDEDRGAQSQHENDLSNSFSKASEETDKPSLATTDKAAKPAKDTKRKSKKDAAPTGGATEATAQHADPELLDELVDEPDAVFGDDISALGVTHAGAPDDTVDASGEAGSALVQSGGSGGIGIHANGIEINVQTTKDGTSVTIKIPKALQQ